MTMLRLTLRDDLALSHFNRREQRGGTVALVITSHRRQPSGGRRQTLLSPIQCMDMSLLGPPRLVLILGMKKLLPSVTSIETSVSFAAFSVPLW